ncbi:MAG: DUF4340 domain-containing protein [Clostridia bacterium]|nr:DUF4340 domain-containing protein [Clostridia bacterium]
MFNKKILVPLIAVIVLLGVLLAVTMLGGNNENNGDISSDINDDYTTNYIFDIDSETINLITVKLSDEKFTLVKEDGSWSLDGSPNTSISTSAVNSLASSIADISYDELIDDGSIKKEDCLINEESEYLSFESELGEITITLGMTTTDGTLCYITTSLTDGIYLAHLDSVAPVFAPLKAYRNSASLRVDIENLVSIDYSSTEKFVLEKGSINKDKAEFNSWKIISPLKIAANDEAVNSKIVEPLKQIKIVDFASDNGDFSSFGLGGKSKYIALTDADGKKQTVYFSSQTAGKYYISIDDNKTIYEVSLSDNPYIALKTIDLADRNITLTKMTNIKNVIIDGPKDYRLDFLSDKGIINGKEISYDTLNQSIFPALCGLMADDIYLGSQNGGEIMITFNYKDSTSSDVVIFSSHNDRYYSVSKNGSVKYLILKSKISDLQKLLEEAK